MDGLLDWRLYIRKLLKTEKTTDINVMGCLGKTLVYSSDQLWLAISRVCQDDLIEIGNLMFSGHPVDRGKKEWSTFAKT